MRSTSLIGLLSFLFLTSITGTARADAKEDLAKQLVGEWKKTETINDKKIDVVIRFEKDKKFKATVQDQSVEGKYEVIDAKTVKVTIAEKKLGLGADKVETLTVEIKDNVLTTIDSQKRTDKFSRVTKN